MNVILLDEQEVLPLQNKGFLKDQCEDMTGLSGVMLLLSIRNSTVLRWSSSLVFACFADEAAESVHQASPDDQQQ